MLVAGLQFPAASGWSILGVGTRTLKLTLPRDNGKHWLNWTQKTTSVWCFIYSLWLQYTFTSCSCCKFYILNVNAVFKPPSAQHPHSMNRESVLKYPKWKQDATHLCCLLNSSGFVSSWLHSLFSVSFYKLFKWGVSPSHRFLLPFPDGTTTLKSLIVSSGKSNKNVDSLLSLFSMV